MGVRRQDSLLALRRRHKLHSLRSQGIEPYPARCHRTCLVNELEQCVETLGREGSSEVFLAGRVLGVRGDGLTLADVSGKRWFPFEISAAEHSGAASPPYEQPGSFFRSPRPSSMPREPVETETETGEPQPVRCALAVEHLEPGDIVQLTLGLDPGCGWVVRRVAWLTKCLGPLVAPPVGQDSRLGEGASVRVLEGRARIMQRVRHYFVREGFLEVETQILALSPGLEPHLDPFETRFSPHPDAPGGAAFLLTSPEYAMKRLIVSGIERVFQISKVFRNGELGPLHNPEFTMLEWYRAYASYLEIQDDLEALVSSLAAELGAAKSLCWQGHQVDLTPPWPRVSVRTAFQEAVGIDLAAASCAESLREAATEAGLEWRDGEGWEEGFFRILVERVEPALGMEKPVFLLDYPAPLAALAKVRQGTFPVAERFELYIAGVEVANAYTELNSPDVQKQRFEAEREQRKSLGLPVFDPDSAYLEALEQGLPPCGGIAVGMDRLIMLLLDQPDVRHTLAFPYPLQV